MGSLCGGNTQTTTSQQSTTPVNLAGLRDVFGQVQSAAQTPFSPFTGESVAPVNDQQRLGISGVNANATTAQPFFSKAADFASASGAPISEDAIQRYTSPFTKNVIDATKANFAEDNGQAQNNLKAKAAMVGAGGGSGQGVAAAELTRQQQLAQAPVLAQLQQSGYTQALNAAQADRAAAGSAAGTFSNIGTSAQRAGLEGAGAQINAGTLEQQTQQQKDAADYRDYLQRLGFPFQSAQFFAQNGVPAALAQGSSTSGTQTAPGPNILAQLAGLGIAGAGVASKFAADGGRVEFADGGSPFNFINDVHGYVPVGGAAPQISLPQSALKFADTRQDGMKPINDAISGIGRGTFKNPFSLSGATGGWGATDTGAEGVGGIGGLYSHGGLVDAIHSIHRAIKHSRGGSVGGSQFQSFAAGGPVRFADGGSLDDRFGAVEQAIADGSFDPMGKNATSFEAAPAPFRLDRSAAAPQEASPSIVPLPQANPMRVSGLPPQITGTPQDDSEPSSALAFDNASPPSPLQIAPQGTAEAPQAKSPFGISPKGSDALIATGLGIMASRSPFALTALGEGGLHGLKNYSDATTAEREAADKKITQGQNQRRVDMEAQRIAQSASQFAKTNSQAERRLQNDLDKTPTGYRAKKDGTYEAIPGGPADPETVKATADAKSGSGLTGPALDIKARQMVNGDYSGLTNIGRGAQAGKTLEKISNRAAEILADEGGMSSAEAAAHMSKKLQEFKASGIYKNAEARTAAGREANLNLILNATEAAIPAALEASDAVARTGWVPINKVIQNGQVIASSPELKRFGMANLQLAEHWARAMNPLGVMRESDRDLALHYLSTADSKDTYRQAVDQLHKQILRERDAVRKGSSSASPNAPPVPGGAAPSETGASAVAPSAAIPAAPTGIPAGSAYSPSRKQWKAPNGTIYNADGSKA